MTSNERFMSAIAELAHEIDAPNLEPDGTRTDWAGHADRLTALRGKLEADILDGMEEALRGLEDPEANERLRGDIALLGGEVAALHFLAGQGGVGDDLLARAVAVAPGLHRLELAAGQEHQNAWVALVHGRWLLRQGRFNDADPVLRGGRKLSKDPILNKAFKIALSGPRPLSGAPPLFTWNGVGTMLYGHRDPRDDGSYIATLFITLLFLPLMPLTAYRVISHGDRGYAFLAKERLSALTRAWRLAVPIGVFSVLCAMGATSWLGSPDRLAAIAVEEAQAVEHAGDADGALARYADILAEYDGDARDATLAPAALGTVRILSGRIAEPMTADRVAEVARVTLRLEQLAGDVREASLFLLDRIDVWTEQVGDASIEDAEASLALARESERIASLAGRQGIGAVIVQRELTVAERLEADWPIFAINLYSKHPSEEQAQVGSRRALEQFSDVPSVLLALEPEIQTLVDAAPEAFSDVQGKVGQAHAGAEEPERLAALEENDAEALKAALTRSPGDQPLMAALASLHRNAGDLPEALALLGELGSAGAMVDDTLILYASCLVEANRLEEADEVLSRFVAVRLPVFTAAQREYDTAAQELMERVDAQVQRGALPRDLEERLMGAADDEQQAIFEQWFAHRVSNDPALVTLRMAYERHSAIVPGALTLGTIKLRRAAEGSGAEREKLLIEAERAFLAIRAEAEGVPSYHLGLGQVYHRLGKVEEGEAEFAGVLSSGDPRLVLAVGKSYRELGLVGRAREVAESVFDGGQQPFRDGAAATLAVMADTLDGKEEWLARIAEPDFGVETELLDVRAQRLVQAGEVDQAADLFGQVAERYGRNSEDNAVAANNQALAYLSRYHCTGRQADLTRGTDGLERALRLRPDNSVTMENLAQTHYHSALLQVLSRWVRPATLRLGVGDAESLFSALLKGDLREQALTALRQSPAYVRSLEITRQEQVLAPRRTDTYSRQLEHFARLEDVASLRELLANMERVGDLDSSSAEERYLEWIEGESEDAFERSVASRRRTSEAALNAAEAAGHRPTLAAAQYLLGDALMDEAITLDGRQGLAERARGLLESAQRNWPSLPVDSSIAWTQLVTAITDVGADRPRLLERWLSERRHYGLDMFLYRLSTDPALSAERDALCAHQATGEAANALLAGHRAAKPRLTEWLVGEATGHEDLSAAGRAVLNSEQEMLEMKIRARLTPFSEDGQQRLLLIGP